jgi:hypothetical protein
MKRNENKPQSNNRAMCNTQFEIKVYVTGNNINTNK